MPLICPLTCEFSLYMLILAHHKLKKDIKMTGNKVKIIACITMFLDHLGLLIFPDIIVFRYIGRIAMPLYAYLISEGAYYTSNKLKYFLEIFLMGVLCQSVYVVEELLSFGVSSLYLNILITFSFSILMIIPYLKAREYHIKADKKKATIYFGVFILSVIFTVLFNFIAENSLQLFNFRITLDYGLTGALLPLSAALFKDKRNKLLSFACFLVLFNLDMAASMPYTWFSLIALIVLLVYNEKRGVKRFKYAFYLFYPLHLAFIYLLSALI